MDWDNSADLGLFDVPTRLVVIVESINGDHPVRVGQSNRSPPIAVGPQSIDGDDSHILGGTDADFDAGAPVQ
jgi:hypothetical protein